MRINNLNWIIICIKKYDIWMMDQICIKRMPRQIVLIDQRLGHDLVSLSRWSLQFLVWSLAILFFYNAIIIAIFTSIIYLNSQLIRQLLLNVLELLVRFKRYLLVLLHLQFMFHILLQLYPISFLLKDTVCFQDLSPVFQFLKLSFTHFPEVFLSMRPNLSQIPPSQILLNFFPITTIFFYQLLKELNFLITPSSYFIFLPPITPMTGQIIHLSQQLIMMIYNRKNQILTFYISYQTTFLQQDIASIYIFINTEKHNCI